MAQSAIITVMERAARKAAPRLRRDFGEVAQLQVSKKGPADFVSNADKAAERTLLEELQKARPGWGFLLEEEGEIAGEPGAPRFIIDPLDGTSNFLHGIPHFAISIAAEHEGVVKAGLVYQPLTDESFWAEQGKGAWLQNSRLRVSGRRDLAECLLATGIPYRGHGNQQQFERIVSHVIPQVAGIRRFGAASLDLAWVAAGRFDGFWEEGLSEWDVAAGILLVREAGGFVSDFRGGDRMIERREIVAGNDATHSKLHRLIAESIRG
ncbi:MAG: inositol monophosphatase family protein [Sphingomonadaceae bacterium]